ncbi:hypothetical protein EZV62_004174 [Acer yangbiense]|uniref:Uncharacterized protein n=1 Tax=Acer yangbiense TaxID=1000413 RepID=A0A5C7IJJ4_9ROSI|nr:hypothetical protein EZV62_004174 [Acer yangbiense]
MGHHVLYNLQAATRDVYRACTVVQPGPALQQNRYNPDPDQMLKQPSARILVKEVDLWNSVELSYHDFCRAPATLVIGTSVSLLSFKTSRRSQAFTVSCSYSSVKIIDGEVEEDTAVIPVIFEDKDDSDEEESEDAMDTDEEKEAADGISDFEGSDAMSD